VNTPKCSISANPSFDQRNLPARGFRPAYYLLAMGAIMTYGFIKVGKGIREQKYAYTNPSFPQSLCASSIFEHNPTLFLRPLTHTT